MIVPVLVGVLMAVAVVYSLQHQHAAHAHAHAAPARAHVPHLRAHYLRPTSRVGGWAVWALAMAVVMQLSLATTVAWGGAPFGALAFALGSVALVHRQERSPLVLLALVVGLFAALFPVAFWSLSSV